MTADAAALELHYAGDAAKGLLLTTPERFGERAEHKAMTREMEDEKPIGRNFTQPITLLSYAAVEVLAQAIKTAGDCDDTSKIAQIIRSRKFRTTAGSLSFKPNGDLTTPSFVVEECEVKRVVVSSRAI